MKQGVADSIRLNSRNHSQIPPQPRLRRRRREPLRDDGFLSEHQGRPIQDRRLSAAATILPCTRGRLVLLRVIVFWAWGFIGAHERRAPPHPCLPPQGGKEKITCPRFALPQVGREKTARLPEARRNTLRCVPLTSLSRRGGVTTSSLSPARSNQGVRSA